MTMAIRSYNNELTIESEAGEIFPISCLDKHRMTSNHNQIGRRWWDEKWGCWSYEILDVKENADVTGFI